jgi:hypothetical protein
MAKPRTPVLSYRQIAPLTLITLPLKTCWRPCTGRPSRWCKDQPGSGLSSLQLPRPHRSPARRDPASPSTTRGRTFRRPHPPQTNRPPPPSPSAPNIDRRPAGPSSPTTCRWHVVPNLKIADVARTGDVPEASADGGWAARQRSPAACRGAEGVSLVPVAGGAAVI